MSTYTIRWYRSGDRPAYLDLYAEVFSEDGYGAAWFDWKYESNPYVDHVPIVVAEREGTVVGARSFFALPVAVAGHRCLALQPCDTMVREPDRRQGLFRRMTERAIDRYEAGGPAFFFNFPNEQTLQGNLDLGWRRVGRLPRAYRVENVDLLLDERIELPGTELAGRVGTALVGTYNRMRESVATVPPRVTVRRYPAVEVGELTDIYQEAVPEAIHAVREPAFYEWRFDDPTSRYATYVAERDSKRVGAVVRHRTGAAGDLEVVRVVDIVPLAEEKRTEAVLCGLFGRIQANFPESDLFVVPGDLPDAVLRRCGFHRDDAAPLACLRTERPHVVRSLSDWQIRGRDITDADSWALTFAELDTA